MQKAIEQIENKIKEKEAEIKKKKERICHSDESYAQLMLDEGYVSGLKYSLARIKEV